MTTVKHVLDKKGNDVHFIHPGASVFDALKLMAENDIGSLVVLEDDKLVGIITERHYAREIVLKGKTSPGTLVRDIMSTKVICARPNQSVEECMAVMTARAVRHLPVLAVGVGPLDAFSENGALEKGQNCSWSLRAWLARMSSTIMSRIFSGPCSW